MKTILTLLMLAMCPALAACGDDSGSRTTTDGVTAPTSGGPTEGAGGPGVAVGGGGRVSTVKEGASEIRIEVAPQGLAYETEHATVEAGETLLHLENPQSVPHDVDLAAVDGEWIADMETIGGGYADVPIPNLEPGEYVFYCTVPGHREAGMEGTVTAE